MQGKEEVELLPGLPEEIALECLTRVHHSGHRVASRVSRCWRDLFLSADFYYLRRNMGRTRKVACLVQALPVPQGPSQSKAAGQPKYGLTVFDPATRTWESLDPVPEYRDGLPLFCRVVGSEGKLLLIGGWDPASYDPVSHVFVYDFATQEWRRGKDMPGTRSFFAVGGTNGRVVVAGGHDRNKDALGTAWVYDVERDEWAELGGMSQERDECEGVVVGNEFWVVSGYGTSRQGGFEGSAEALSLDSGEWRRVEGAWEAGRCPRSCAGVGGGDRGQLFDWGECNPEVRVGPCGVQLGGWALVSGSAYQDGPHSFFLVDSERGNWEKLDKVPEEFSGYVPSGCCVEI